MQQKLDTLLQLQKIDLRLKELEATRGDLPQKVEKTRNELNKVQEELESQKKELRETRLDREKNKVDQNEARTRLKKYQDQLYRVTTNREYDALTVEIDMVKARIDQLELQELELEEKEEQLQVSIQDLESRLTSLQRNLQVYEKELQEKLNITIREEESLRKQRQELVAQLDRRIYSTYERVRKAKNGLAVVPVQRGACGGCHSAIPPQRVLEVRQRNKFITCEVCGRILIWDENESPQQVA
ncbi:MAG TPA: hypothetical protein ENJ23_03225 [Bacteroidetes bacterium]|nr:hypothetical protein [Bacteroidota bacterium]